MQTLYFKTIGKCLASKQMHMQVCINYWIRSQWKVEKQCAFLWVCYANCIWLDSTNIHHSFWIGSISRIPNKCKLFQFFFVHSPRKTLCSLFIVYAVGVMRIAAAFVPQRSVEKKEWKIKWLIFWMKSKMMFQCFLLGQTRTLENTQ